MSQFVFLSQMTKFYIGTGGLTNEEVEEMFLDAIGQRFIVDDNRSRFDSPPFDKVFKVTLEETKFPVEGLYRHDGEFVNVVGYEECADGRLYQYYVFGDGTLYQGPADQFKKVSIND